MAAQVVRKTLTSVIPRNNPPFKSNPHVYFFTSKAKPPSIADSLSQFLLKKHNFSPEAASQAATALTRINNLERSDSILSFLKGIGFSTTQLERTVSIRPQLLSSNLDRSIKPKIEVLRDFGFSDTDIPEIVSKEPLVFHCSAKKRLIPSLSVLKGLLGSVEEVAKLLRVSGWFLVLDLEKTLVPNVEFLTSCGVSMEQITRHIYNFPRFFLRRPDTVRGFIDKAVEMGVDRSSRLLIHAARVVSSMTVASWELKLRTFRNLGFSEDDILRAFRSMPIVFAVSEKKIRKVVEVLLESGKYDMSCIKSYPSSLLYSVEKRYKPRLGVLEVLEKRSLIEKWPSIGPFHKMSDYKFYQKYVAPYLDEVGEAYLGKSLQRQKQSVIIKS